MLSAAQALFACLFGPSVGSCLVQRRRGVDDAAEPRRKRDQPWLFRTYAGHSSAAASNALYRTNLARGQTGLSVAFDLPTQTGYDATIRWPAARSARSACRSASIGDMATLFDGIPLEQMNTSMTINATAPWLLALYIAAAEQQGADVAQAAGHGPERHHQGISVARDLHLPAQALACG